jgi:hypothetical protein
MKVVVLNALADLPHRPSSQSSISPLPGCCYQLLSVHRQVWRLNSGTPRLF